MKQLISKFDAVNWPNFVDLVYERVRHISPNFGFNVLIKEVHRMWFDYVDSYTGDSDYPHHYIALGIQHFLHEWEGELSPLDHRDIDWAEWLVQLKGRLGNDTSTFWFMYVLGYQIRKLRLNRMSMRFGKFLMVFSKYLRK